MNGTASGSGTEKKSYPAKGHARASSSTECSFCWFVLTVYPTLKGMTTRDDATFREHLRKVHGLREEIRA